MVVAAVVRAVTAITAENIAVHIGMAVVTTIIFSWDSHCNSSGHSGDGCWASGGDYTT